MTEREKSTGFWLELGSIILSCLASGLLIRMQVETGEFNLLFTIAALVPVVVVSQCLRAQTNRLRLYIREKKDNDRT